MMIRRRNLLLACGLFLLQPASALAGDFPPGSGQPLSAISEVRVDPILFNPSAGQTTTISCRTPQSSKVALRIFDPDLGLIREFIGENRGQGEPLLFQWDGRDLHGRVVPDEAYSITLEAMGRSGRITVYDPSTFSGGQTVLREKGRYDAERQCIPYRLERAARVKIRAGITDGGPLLKSIVNGRPTLAGARCEPWDGLDESGVIPVIGLPKQILSVEAGALIEQSVLTTGNREYDYFRYARELAPQRPKKTMRPRLSAEGATGEIVPLEPRPLIPEPKFSISLPEGTVSTGTGLPLLSGKVPVRIRLDDRVKRYATEDRYEILFFVDFMFVTEREEGYSPFTLNWDSRTVANGEHLVTVNVATLSGQVSSGSVKVWVQNEN